MLRFSLALLLVCASAQAMAQNGRGAPANPGACHETAAVAGNEVDSSGATQSKASTARSKYARPASPASSSGGGGSDDALPRSRGTRWHSFLPGMFR